jgi:CHASE1-domain containing sensor protein
MTLRRPLPWVVLAIGLAATFALSHAARDAHEAKTREEFHRRFDAAVDAIRLRMLSYEYIVRSAAAFLGARGEPTRPEWTAYVSAMRIERDFPGLALAYGRPGEVDSGGARRSAIERARDTGEASLSGKIALPGEAFRGQPPQLAGVVLFMPVYRKGIAPGTVEERRAALQGLVAGTVRVNDALVIGSHALRDLELELYDGEKAFESAALAGRVGDLRTRSEMSSMPDLVRTARLEVAGRPWTVKLEARNGFEDRMSRRLPAVVLVAGLLISLLAFFHAARR